MRLLRLKEYETERRVPLSIMERDAFGVLAPNVRLVPATGLEDSYDLTPGSWVGTMQFGALHVEIRPKISIPRVLFLLSYAMNPAHWKDTPFAYEEADSLLEAIIPGYIVQIRRAFRGGILQGYRTVDETLMTVRGRLRFEDQVRYRFGRFPPAEVRYDDYTEDIEANRLIKAALHRLQRMPVRSMVLRQSLREFESLLTNVTLISYDPRRMPSVSYTRLNERYRFAIELSRLILKSTSLDLYAGTAQSSTFLVNMNEVFENFVVVALREALGVSNKTLRQGAAGRVIHLDQADALKLEPDLSWWDSFGCTFVGDVKYKRLGGGEIKNGDVYQMLAYTIATDLPGGLLIYASGEAMPTTHEVVHVGKAIYIRVLDVTRSPQDVLEQIGAIAGQIALLRQTAVLKQFQTAAKTG